MANCVCVMTKILRLYKFTSLAIAGEHGKRHATRTHKQEAVSDWLNPQSFDCIENLA